MVGILRHRPEGNSDIRPDIRRIGKPEASPVVVLPVAWDALSRPVGCEHPTPEFDCVEIEGVGVRHGTEPDVLRTVFPVGCSAAPFFTLPRYTVAHRQVTFRNAVDSRRRAPVAADIHR